MLHSHIFVTNPIRSKMIHWGWRAPKAWELNSRILHVYFPARNKMQEQIRLFVAKHQRDYWRLEENKISGQNKNNKQKIFRRGKIEKITTTATVEYGEIVFVYLEYYFGCLFSPTCLLRTHTIIPWVSGEKKGTVWKLELLAARWLMEKCKRFATFVVNGSDHFAQPAFFPFLIGEADRLLGHQKVTNRRNYSLETKIGPNTITAKKVRKRRFGGKSAMCWRGESECAIPTLGWPKIQRCRSKSSSSQRENRLESVFLQLRTRS